MSDRPAFLLDIPLAALDAWWLEAGCCGHAVRLPYRMLARQRGGAFTLGEVLGLLRCRRCGMRAGVVTLLDDAADRAHGRIAPGGWRVAITLPDSGHGAGALERIP